MLSLTFPFQEIHYDCPGSNRNSELSLVSTATPLVPISCNIRSGIYKKCQVRVKEISFPGRKGISRDVMKELKILREIQHKNINTFIGAHVLSNNKLQILTELCSRGCLQDILANKEDIKLDQLWVTSLVSDLVKGMQFLHYSTPIAVHGNLRSANCVVTSMYVISSQFSDGETFGPQTIWPNTQFIQRHSSQTPIFVTDILAKHTYGP